jgi:hypothetical protein
VGDVLRLGPGRTLSAVAEPSGHRLRLFLRIAVLRWLFTTRFGVVGL